MSVSTQPPSGFRDFLNQEATLRSRLIEIISRTYQSFGFSPLDTPALEHLSVLLGSGGGENEKLIFKVMKRGEKLKESLASQNEDAIADFGMRFDLTVPLSRVVANYRNDISLPWKVFHLGPVWRAERAQKGRFREFTQCDVDIVGAKPIGAELEVIQAVVAATHAAGAEGFELKINDRRLLQALAERNGFSGEKANSFFITLDKKDKISASDLENELKNLGGSISPELKKMIHGEFTLEEAVSLNAEVANEMKEMISILNDLRLPLAAVQFDPSLARGLGYYTGPIYELRHPSAGYSLGGGGRYDKLIGRFAGQEIPACGFSIGFDRLLLLLAEKEIQNDQGVSTIFIPVFDETLRARLLKQAAQLRQVGLDVDVYPHKAKLANQFKFAADKNYRWVLIAGSDEWSSGQFKVKDFKTEQETPVTADKLIDYLKNISRPSK